MSVTWTLVAALKPAALETVSVKTTVPPTGGVGSSTIFASDRSMIGFGVVEAVRGLEQLGEVVEVDGDVGVFGSVGLLVDGQRAAHQRLGRRQTVRGLEQLRQVVEVGGHARVLEAQHFLVNRQRPPVKRLGLAVPSLITVDQGQRIEALTLLDARGTTGPLPLGGAQH